MHLKISFLTWIIFLSWCLTTSLKAENAVKNQAYAINWSNEITDIKICKLALANFNWYCDWFWPENKLRIKDVSGFKYYWFDFNQDDKLDLYIWEHGTTSKVCGKWGCSSYVILQEKPTSNSEHFKWIKFPAIIRDDHPHLFWPDIGKLGSISIPDTVTYDTESNLEDHKLDIEVFLKEENSKNITVRDDELIIK